MMLLSCSLMLEPIRINLMWMKMVSARTFCTIWLAIDPVKPIPNFVVEFLFGEQIEAGRSEFSLMLLEKGADLSHIGLYVLCNKHEFKSIRLTSII